MTGKRVRYDFNGEQLTLADISRRTGIEYQTIASRKHRGIEAPELWSRVEPRGPSRNLVSRALEKWR